MQRSQSTSLMTFGLLLACAYSSAEDRSVSSSQRYTIHVPQDVKFGQLQPAADSQPAVQSAAQPAVQSGGGADAAAVVFMAETTSGMTIQFETQSEPTRKLPFQLTVGGSRPGSWWANNAHDAAASTHESVATGTVVQASTLGAGWTTLEIVTTHPPIASDEAITTIVVTIVAH